MAAVDLGAVHDGTPLWHWSWTVRYGDLRGLCEVIPFDDLSPREVRCYRSVRPSVVTYVATRTTGSRRRTA